MNVYGKKIMAASVYHKELSTAYDSLELGLVSLETFLKGIWELVPHAYPGPMDSMRAFCKIKDKAMRII